MDNYTTEIYRLDNNGFTQLFYGLQENSYEEIVNKFGKYEYIIHSHFYIYDESGRTKVTEEEFFATQSIIYDFDSSEGFGYYDDSRLCDYSEIVQQIKHWSTIPAESPESPKPPDSQDITNPTTPKVSGKTDAATGKPLISWTSVENAIQYKVYRATSSTGIYENLKTITGTEFLDDTASFGKKYYYKVKAVNAENEASSFSAYTSATCKCAAPAVTTSVSTTNGKVKVSWKKVSSAKKYEVYRATSTGSFKKLTSTSSTSYTDASASVGTTYRYKVKAVASKSTYNSSYSATLTAKRICAQPDLEVEISSTGKPYLSWDKVSGAKEYKILRAESQNGEYQLLTTTTSTSYTDTTAEFDKDYWYQVDVVGSKSGTDNTTDAAVKVHTTCAKPSVSVKLSSKKPKVSWKPVEGATKYYVYRATSKSGKYTKVATVTDATSYTDKKAKKGKTYYYKVKAIAANSAANSAYSSVKSIKSK